MSYDVVSRASAAATATSRPAQITGRSADFSAIARFFAAHRDVFLQ